MISPVGSLVQEVPGLFPPSAALVRLITTRLITTPGEALESPAPRKLRRAIEDSD